MSRLRNDGAVAVASKRGARPPRQVRATCIMVVGMHRSGTSAFAGLLGMLGCRLPARLVPAVPSNPKGHFEPADVVPVHEEMLAALGTAYDDWRPVDEALLSSSKAQEFRAALVSILEENFPNASLFVIKEPRICRLVGFWRSVIAAFGADLRIVIPIRHPLEVAHSLRQRNAFPLARGQLLWLRHMLDAEFASRGVPRVFVRYADLLDDWRSVAARLERELSLSFPSRSPETDAAVDAFLDPALRSHVAARGDLGSTPGLDAWLAPAVDAFERLVTDSGDGAAATALDQVRASFDEVSARVGDHLHEQYRAAEAARGLQAERDYFQEQSARWQQEAERRSGDIERLARVLQELEAANAALEAQRRSWQEQAERKSGEFERLARVLQELEAAKAALEAQRRSWQEQAERKSGEFERLAGVLQELEAANAALEEQRRSWHEQAERKARDVQRLAGVLQDFEDANAALERQRRSWEQEAARQGRAAEELAEKLTRFESANAALEQQRRSWQQEAERKAAELQQLAGVLAECQAAIAWLDEQRLAWQRQAQDAAPAEVPAPSPEAP